MLIHRTGRQSFVIGGKAAQTSYHAAAQAKRIGFPLNFGVTINFGLTEIDPRNAVEAFGRLRRNHFNKWATRPRKGKGPAFPPTYVFTFENERDDVAFETIGPGQPHNVHVHWELHIPPSRVHDFEMQLWCWIERTCGAITGGGVEKITSLYGGQSRRNYLVKGTSPAHATLYGRGEQASPQGIIVGGNRTGVSRNLGPTARRKLDQELGIRRRIPARSRQASQASAAP